MEETTEVPDEYKWDMVLDSMTPEVDEIEDYDQFLNMEVLLPQNGEHLRAAKVLGVSEQSKGRYDLNPVENSQIYDVMFPDGSIQQYTANIIAENLVAQILEYLSQFQTIGLMELSLSWLHGKMEQKP